MNYYLPCTTCSTDEHSAIRITYLLCQVIYLLDSLTCPDDIVIFVFSFSVECKTGIRNNATTRHWIENKVTLLGEVEEGMGD